MTAKAIIAVVAGTLVAAAVAYHFVRPSTATPVTVTEVTGDRSGWSKSEQPAPRPATPMSYSSEGTAGEQEDEPLTASIPGLGTAEIEIIDGIRVKKDRNCTLRLVNYFTMPDGTVVPSHICEPDKPRQIDPYTTYSNEALKTLAYSDPHAAHVLSQRFREKDFAQALNYALRSSVLADDTDSVRWLLNTYPAQTYENEQVQVHVVENNYVLSGVIYALGGPGHDLARWTSIAHKHAADGIDTEVLDHRIAELMNTVESIRSEAGIE